MLIELYENEYKYIIECFKELLPKYYLEIKKTLNIDDYMNKLNPNNKIVYSFDLFLEDKDIEAIIQMKNKLQKYKNLEDFELYDKYVDFFFFIQDYCKRSIIKT